MTPDHSIFVTDSDFSQLRRLASHPSLAAELMNAVVVDSGRVPPDVVTMNSRVRFEDENTGTIRDVTIVFPDQADATRGNVSILATIGTALLGLSVGQRIRWPFPDGSTHSLRVLALIYQPENENTAASGSTRK
ncbi:MAG: nucleoside diphosphate kinase regulator [Casimicrobiaceae bacterium]